MCCNRNNTCGCGNEIIAESQFGCGGSCEIGGGCGTENRVYNCNLDRQVVKHRHIVKHRHDIINEYDVIHEHDYYYHNAVRTREVVRHHENTPYNPNYCPEGQNCGIVPLGEAIAE
ncbi:MAG: hypothetical protein FWG90_11350 [Oscillospiraceae bacterium]|nr:hypothetical protein [Oscillospiraceae bacterium]